MAVHVSILLVLTGLTGIHSVTTVTKVSVKVGDSISIPCLYEPQYINHVKYLCEGYTWASCGYAVKTTTRWSQKFLISDDKIQKIFKVTIKQLMTRDTDFWCVVEINHGADVGQYFHLAVTAGHPRLNVDNQEITGFKGENIAINCSYSISGESKWCRLGMNCVGRSGSIHGTNVRITESNSTFTVTMSKLKLWDSGWYYCLKGDFQMPVHITVTERPETTTTVTIDSTITQVHTHSVEDGSRSVPIDLKVFIIPLSLLVLIVTVALLVWFILRRKETKTESSAKAKAEEDITYSTVGFTKSPQGSKAERDTDVTYSSVVTIRQQNVKREEAKDADVTYSTVAQRQQNM